MGMFGRLRDDRDRSEAVAALSFAAGVAAALALATSEVRDLDVVEAGIWLFVSGLCLGFAIYWIAGWALGFVVPRLGGSSERRRTRHVLAYSFVPLAFALPAWLIWPPLIAPLAAGSLVLLVLGLCEVEAWSPARATAAVVLAAVWLVTLLVCLWSVLALLNGAFE
jgi:hypothetical protein